jgi:predicted CXXCH cytochrome family protein
MNENALRMNLRRLWGLAAFAALALGGFGIQSALAGIADTKHNLGTSASVGGGRVNQFSGTDEICVFCHTPHGSDTSAAVPLWNRTLASPASYSTYNSLGTSSLDGATAPVGSVSLACLSCHDGSQAMNTIINQPGSGSTNATYAAGGWSGANQTLGKINTVAMLDVDLKNDHPIGIQYAGGPIAATLPAAGSDYTGFKDPDFNLAKSAALNGTQVWWVDTGTTGRQKTDMQLYTRTEAAFTGGTGTSSAIASTVPQPYVECASCHDPHSSTNPTFLRISNAGSAVCLACHIK